MSNFDEDIKRINDEMMADGTIDNIIRERLTKAYTDAVDNAFRWGDLKDAIEKRLKEILIPAIERSDLSDYVVKLDEILTSIIHETSLPDHKRLLEHFDTIICKKMPKTITLEEILDKYMEFCKEELECCGRKVDTDEGDPSYENCEAQVTVEDDDRYGRFSNEYAVLLCQIGEDESDENKEKLNRRVRLTHYSWEKEEGYRIEYSGATDITSLKYMPDFDVWLLALSQNGTRVIAERGDGESDEFEPNAQPECEWT